MTTGTFLTRESALDYLATRPEFHRLYRDRQGRGRSLEDLGAAQARRYANRLYQAVRAGVDTSQWKDLGPLRGHEASERHAGRAPKHGYENYVKPERVKRGKFFTPNAEGRIVSELHVTSGERSAERAILQGIRQQVHGRPRQVAINITGGKAGQYAQLFWKGGYNAEALLTMAGWRKNHRGRWFRPPLAKGLEEALLDYIANMPRSKYVKWGAIALYEVYVYDTPIVEVADPASRWTVAEWRQRQANQAQA